jgi:hypothetical protein
MARGDAKPIVIVKLGKGQVGPLVLRRVALCACGTQR